MASRVVPGRSKTIWRCSPSKRLTKVDLPTLGRPTMAVRMASGSGSAEASTSGSRSARKAVKAATPPPVAGGDQMCVRKAETGEVGCRGFGIEAIDLVDDQHDLPAAAPQMLGNGFIRSSQSSPGIDQEEHAMGVGQGHLGLLADELGKLAVRTQPAGVDQHAGLAAQLGPAIAAVPGQAGHVGDQRIPAAGETIEQSGFADVGPASQQQLGNHRASISMACREPELPRT